MNTCDYAYAYIDRIASRDDKFQMQQSVDAIDKEYVCGKKHVKYMKVGR